MYVGIDPSITNTGIVVLGADGKLVEAFNGKEAYKGTRKDDFDSSVERYLAQARYIIGKLKKYDILASAYEDYSLASVHRAYDLAEYGGVLKRELYAIGLTPYLVPPTVNKKFATGNGASSKDYIMARAIYECPELEHRRALTNDITDAYFLAKYAWYRNDTRSAIDLEKGNNVLRARLEILRNSNVEA